MQRHDGAEQAFGPLLESDHPASSIQANLLRSGDDWIMNLTGRSLSTTTLSAAVEHDAKRTFGQGVDRLIEPDSRTNSYKTLRTRIAVGAVHRLDDG
jgi:hypothetical protein